MTRVISLFNHKGGVSKTTTTFNLGWKLAEKGHRVILVDADPQSNLTGLLLGHEGPDDLDAYYKSGSGPDLKSALAPAFESKLAPIEGVECLSIKNRKNLFLLPGHIGLAEYETTLAVSQEISQSILTLQNVPGSINHLIRITAEKMKADYVLLDLNPSLSAFNKNLLLTSDFFIVPTTPDFFSVMAVKSLVEVIPRWKAWAETLSSLEVFKNASYPFPKPQSKFLGVIIQNFRPRDGKPAASYKKWIGKIKDLVEKELVPALEKVQMTLPDEKYVDGYCLAEIPHLTGLLPQSHLFQKPVYALSDAEIDQVGAVLERYQQNREEFSLLFDELATRVVVMTS